VCKINGKSAKNIARKSGKHQRSKNPPNWFLKGSVVFVGSKRETLPPTTSQKCALGNEYENVERCEPFWCIYRSECIEPVYLYELFIEVRRGI
jgi:hypothetical protein